MKFGQIDVIVYKDGYQIPEDENILYLIAKNGIFMYKKSRLLRSLVKVDGINHLPSLEPFGELDIPRISKEMLAPVIIFFKKIYEMYKAEAGVRIFYNSQTKHYILDVPKQKISVAQVEWENSHPPTGYQYVGTIHSHVTMSAFHSGVDKGSEDKLDGIHIVFGNVDTDEPSVTGTIVINANRFKLDEESLLRYFERNITNREETIKYSCNSMYEDYVASKTNDCNTGDITAKTKAFKLRFNIDIDMSSVEVAKEWYESIIYEQEVIYKMVYGKLIRCSKYSNISVPKVNLPLETKYLSKPDPDYNYKPISPIVIPSSIHIPSNNMDSDYNCYPLIDYTICPKCRYREVAIAALELGFVDNLLLTTIGCYGEPNFQYDSFGNMIDTDGNIIISAKELES